MTARRSSELGLGAGPAAPSHRVILIPLASRRSRIVAVALTLAIAASLATAILRPLVAESLAARRASVAALARALAWDPKNPGLHLRLGLAYASAASPEPGRARFHLERALSLRPTDAYLWLHLAWLADAEGDRDRARAALQEVIRLDPHKVSFRWEAGLLAMGWGERERALEHFRYVLAVDPSQRDAAFQLGRLLLPPGADPGSLLPQDPSGLANVLLAAIRHGDLALAEVAWTRRAPLTPPLPAHVGRRYLERLLEEGHGDTARRVWNTLVPDGSPTPGGDAIWNGGFEAERLLGWGLDWRLRRAWGVDVVLDRFVAAGGSTSLRLTFNSFPTLNFAGVSQLVAVEPGRDYRLRALGRAADFTTRSGLKLEVLLPKGRQVLAETGAITATTEDWVPLEAHVRIPPETSLVLLRLRREPSPGPEGNLGGKVWVDDVSLVPLGTRAPSSVAQ